MSRFLFVLVALAVCLNQAAAQGSNRAESSAKATPIVDSASAPASIADSLAAPAAKGDSVAAAPGTVAVGLKDSSAVPPPDTTLAVGSRDSSEAPALNADSVKSSPVPAAIVKETLADSASLSRSAAAVVPSKDSSSLAATPDTAAKGAVLQGTLPLAASPKAAPKDSTGGMEWKTLADSGSDSNYAAIPPSNAAPKVKSSSSSFFPDIPADRESQVLMYTGAGLAAVGLVAFLVFNTTTSKATTSSANVDDGGGSAANPNAPSQKIMTIQWAP